MKRTNLQNNAMHQFFTNLATTLNDAGLSMQIVLDQVAEVQWTPYSIKEVLWKGFQVPMTGKISTTELETEQVSEVYENLNAMLSEKFGVTEHFPSVEEQMLQDLTNNPKNYV
jgi:hypothetical protein